MILNVKIKPNARKNVILVDSMGNMKIKVNAPPIDGKANKELVNFLSEIFDVPKSCVEILSGFTGQNKKIKIIGEEKKLSKTVEDLKAGKFEK